MTNDILIFVHLQCVFHGIRLLRLMKRLVVVRQSIFFAYNLRHVVNISGKYVSMAIGSLNNPKRALPLPLIAA